MRARERPHSREEDAKIQGANHRPPDRAPGNKVNTANEGKREKKKEEGVRQMHTHIDSHFWSLSSLLCSLSRWHVHV